MDNIDALADQLRKKLPSQRVRELASCFSYPEPDPLPKIGSAYRTHRYLTLAQTSELVEWKAKRGHGKKFCSKNEDTSVRRLTKMAAQAADQYRDSPEIAASILTALDEVHLATASTILTAWNPDVFGIIDIRVWSALRGLTGSSTFDRGKRTLFNSKEFRVYTLLLRRWRDLVGICPRIIDKALWQYDKESGKRA